MGIINLLDLQTANLIAAGEVVERAASVVKELIENSIDAGARAITVEIRKGGNTYIRVSDDGKGIREEDMPKTILRHATSKIKTGDDLEEIGTLGFRGEALAAISSVAKLTIISKRADSDVGNTLESNDEDGVYIKETGCPKGTTVIVRDLFYNVPARRKFMKRDATEAMAITTITEKLAMSHPSISFKLISDRETKFTTTGDGKLLSAIYGVAGRAFASNLEEVSYELEGVRLRGYISRPEASRGTRSAQSFFINNRYIRSRTITAAIDEAFKSYIPTGRFPAAVLFLDTALIGVDVNVHPSKLEVRFSDEKSIFDTVYYGVLSALEKGFGPKHDIYEHEAPVNNLESYEMPPKNEENREVSNRSSPKNIYTSQPTPSEEIPDNRLREIDVLQNIQNKIEAKEITSPSLYNESKDDEFASEGLLNEKEQEKLDLNIGKKQEFRLVGEIFSTYAVIELGEEVALIDKHAAHERIIYESLKKSNEKHSQLLLEPLELILSPEERELLKESRDYLESYGFVISEKGEKGEKIFLDGIPQALTGVGGDLQSIIGTIVEELAISAQIPVNIRADKALYAAACKAAVKAGRVLEFAQLEWLAEQVINDGGVRYCPHGRPVIQFFAKKNISKLFDRT